MNNMLCTVCGTPMKRNGKTKDGVQRWRCKKCGSSKTHRINSDAKDLERFVNWLLSRDKQIDMPGQGRGFRKRTARFWSIWPMPPVVDEIHKVIYVDGIYIGKDLVILIACSDEYVLSWYLARSENSSSWKALLSQIAPPDMVITDGGSGFYKAVKEVWPSTKVQRCLFHVFCQVKRATTSRPRLLAGKEIYKLAKELMKIKTIKEAMEWEEKYYEWARFWNDFLDEKSYIDGKYGYTHERLRKARKAIAGLLSKRLLFTYLDPQLTTDAPLPCMNNRIEGGVNAQIRTVLRDHRGMSSLHRIKAVYWYCYMKTEAPMSMAEILKSMPTDDDIDFLYENYGITQDCGNEPVEWGQGLVWNELHTSTRYPYSVD